MEKYKVVVSENLKSKDLKESVVQKSIPDLTNQLKEQYGNKVSVEIDKEKKTVYVMERLDG